MTTKLEEAIIDFVLAADLGPSTKLFDRTKKALMAAVKEESPEPEIPKKKPSDIYRNPNPEAVRSTLRDWTIGAFRPPKGGEKILNIEGYPATASRSYGEADPRFILVPRTTDWGSEALFGKWWE